MLNNCFMPEYCRHHPGYSQWVRTNDWEMRTPHRLDITMMSHCMAGLPVRVQALHSVISSVFVIIHTRILFQVRCFTPHLYALLREARGHRQEVNTSPVRAGACLVAINIEFTKMWDQEKYEIVTQNRFCLEKNNLNMQINILLIA